MKFRYIIITFLFIVQLSTLPVKKIGKYLITESELTQEMSKYEDFDDYDEMKKKAMSELTLRKLVKIYADRNFITVDDYEVEQYFLNIFSDHEKFLTNGHFDYSKYEKLKDTPPIQAILKQIKEDLIIKKAKSILKKDFNITDKKLLELYTLENAQIDLGYAKIKKNMVNVPFECTPEAGFDFYKNNSNRYDIDKEVKLRLVVIKNSDLMQVVEVTNDTLYRRYLNLETTKSFSEVKDSLKNEIKKAEAAALAKIKSYKVYELLHNGEMPGNNIIETDYLSLDDKLANFEKADLILEEAIDKEEGYISEPIEIDFGYLIYQVIDIADKSVSGWAEIADKVWMDFVESKRSVTFKNKYYDYYKTHIDSFIAPAVYVSKLIFNESEISKHIYIGKDQVRKYYKNNRERFAKGDKIYSLSEVSELIKKRIKEKKIEQIITQIKKRLENSTNWKEEIAYIADDFEYKFNREIIFLGKFDNKGLVERTIAKDIKKENFPSTGYTKYKEKNIFYKTLSYFPEYLPKYSEVEHVIHDFINLGNYSVENIDFEEYYTLNKKKFFTKDSLKLGGIFVPVKKDTTAVPDSICKRFYENNKEDFYQQKSYRVDFIYIKDPNNRKSAYMNYLYRKIKNKEVEFKLIRKLFSDKYRIENKIYTSNDLNKEKRAVLEKMVPASVSEPHYFEDGWYLFKLINKYQAGYNDFTTVKDSIKKMIKLERGIKFAKNKVQTYLDSIKYYSHCKTYVDSSNLFETELLASASVFGPLGKIPLLKDKFMRLYRWEKYPTVISKNNGFAIVFLLKKVKARQMSFEEALPKVKAVYREEKKYQHQKEYIQNLIQMVKSGASPDSIFYFFGGWSRIKDLSLDSSIPGVVFGDAIMQDIVNKQMGEFSHIISISDKEYLIFRVERKKTVSESQFYENKEDFKKKIIKKKFDDWVSDFKSSVEIIKY